MQEAQGPSAGASAGAIAEVQQVEQGVLVLCAPVSEQEHTDDAEDVEEGSDLGCCVCHTDDVPGRQGFLVTTACGHTMCRKCACQWIDKCLDADPPRPASCPYCRTPFSEAWSVGITGLRVPLSNFRDMVRGNMPETALAVMRSAFKVAVLEFPIWSLLSEPLACALKCIGIHQMTMQPYIDALTLPTHDAWWPRLAMLLAVHAYNNAELKELQSMPPGSTAWKGSNKHPSLRPDIQGARHCCTFPLWLTADGECVPHVVAHETLLKPEDLFDAEVSTQAKEEVKEALSPLFFSPSEVSSVAAQLAQDEDQHVAIANQLRSAPIWTLLYDDLYEYAWGSAAASLAEQQAAHVYCTILACNSANQVCLSQSLGLPDGLVCKRILNYHVPWWKKRVTRRALMPSEQEPLIALSDSIPIAFKSKNMGAISTHYKHAAALFYHRFVYSSRACLEVVRHRDTQILIDSASDAKLACAVFESGNMKAPPTEADLYKLLSSARGSTKLEEAHPLCRCQTLLVGYGRTVTVPILHLVLWHLQPIRPGCTQPTLSCWALGGA